MGNKSTIELISLPYLVKQYKDDQIILRPTMKEHIQLLRKYIINGIETKQVFLPMLVANKTSNGKLQMIDGSTRVRAISSIFDSLQKENYSEEQATKLKIYFENSSIGIQVYHDLLETECDQLYLDFNTKGKKVALSKLIEYDSRNLQNVVTNQLIERNKTLKEAGIETEKRAVIRPTNKNFLSLSQLRQLVKVFMEGNHQHTVSDQGRNYPLTETEYIQLMDVWFNEIFKWHHYKTIGNYENTMLASFPIILSLAYYVNKDVESQSFESRFKIIETKLPALSQVDWSPNNDRWKTFKGTYRKGTSLYFLKNEMTTIKQLIDWYEGLHFKEVMGHVK